MLAIGLFYFVGIFAQKMLSPALCFGVLTYGAAVAVRFYGMVVDQVMDSSILWRILMVEVTGLFLCLGALWLCYRMDSHHG